ncbi:uncharacterized protein LOC131304462 [Rhododendron vialii]|uniref:uncharacterized protein LOC131304462 n=1 Tax=Rhododendron vialii TaxID=182163 RepID=UPI00265FD884|nr:uncharacterized protein LOC131304462 [Rhododendron vialii]
MRINDIEDIALFEKKFKRSFKKNINLGLATKLKQCEKEKIDALHELDVLKCNHMNLKNDMHSLCETNMVLESKVAKLQVELDKANAIFKKLSTGAQVLKEMLSVQKVTSNREGLGYAGGASKHKVEYGETDSIKPNSSAPIPLPENKARLPIKENNVKYVHKKPNSPKTKKQSGGKVNEMNSTKVIFKPPVIPIVQHNVRKAHDIKKTNNKKFVPTCHYCQVKGHTRPQCRKVHSSNTSHMHLVCSHDFIKFIPICHFCGMRGHI